MNALTGKQKFITKIFAINFFSILLFEQQQKKGDFIYVLYRVKLQKVKLYFYSPASLRI